MYIRLSILLFCFFGISGFAQEKSTEKKRKLLYPRSLAIPETSDIRKVPIKIVKGERVFTNPEALLIRDSLKIHIRHDDPQLASLDSIWKQELYSTHLYDTLYNSVRNLNYKEVYYPDLPTDTLKARLADLNARTPFNIAYNPSLENVIKNYLKNRKDHLERLMSFKCILFPVV